MVLSSEGVAPSERGRWVLFTVEEWSGGFGGSCVETPGVRGRMDLSGSERRLRRRSSGRVIRVRLFRSSSSSSILYRRPLRPGGESYP